MKISEVCYQLQKISETHGDLEVLTVDQEDGNWVTTDECSVITFSGNEQKLFKLNMDAAVVLE